MWPLEARGALGTARFQCCGVRTEAMYCTMTGAGVFGTYQCVEGGEKAIDDVPLLRADWYKPDWWDPVLRKPEWSELVWWPSSILDASSAMLVQRYDLEPTPTGLSPMEKNVSLSRSKRLRS